MALQHVQTKSSKALKLERGTGFFLDKLRNMGAERLVGADISKEMVRVGGLR